MTLNEDQLLRLYDIETRNLHQQLDHILKIRGTMALAYTAILSATLLLLGLATSACLILFLTDVPLAIRAAQGPAALGVKKAIVKTSMLGVGFVVLYLLGGSAGLRRLQRRA